MILKKLFHRSMSYCTKLLKVDPASIKFSATAHIDGSLPEISDENTYKALLEAAALIRDTNEVVAFPTETVYGLGGSSLNDKSVLNIYKAKNRPSDNPLITHVSSIDQLNKKIYNLHQLEGNSILEKIPSSYHHLIGKLWPGPLTILLPVPSEETNALSKLTTADQPTFAVRIPSNPVARALIALSDTPIAAPSANASTRPSPTLASHVYNDLQGRIPLILDGGACKVGVESTVVDGLSATPIILRPGGFTYEEIIHYGGEKWTECKVERRKALEEGEKARTPGMKYKHYSPSAKVILLAPNETTESFKIMEKLIELFNTEIKSTNVKKVAILTSFKMTALVEEIKKNIPSQFSNQTVIKGLGTTGIDIQKNLFAALRDVDEVDKVDLIFVEGVTENEEGLAIMNRLKKAAGHNHIYI